MSADLTSASTPRDLERALLCFEVAVDLSPLISTVVEEHNGRTVIARDIVDCWLELPVAVRIKYEAKRLPTAPGFDGHPPVPALSRFLGDYVDAIDESWIPAGTDPYTIDPDTAERLHRNAWRRHERQIRERIAAHRSPERQFVRKLASPADFTGDGWNTRT